ncbi:uncharacterized protein LOC144010690 [Festucalex cinctus]
MNQKLNLLNKMNTQELILIFLLQFEVISGQTTNVFARAGDVAVLPCEQSSCSGIGWLYSRDGRPVVSEVKNGQVVTSSPRSQRLSLNNDCSLRIDGVTAEDVGSFACERDGERIFNIELKVMTLTLQDSNSMGDGHVVLKCSLACYPALNCRCREKVLRWMDEDDKELSSDRTEQNNCVSFLNVPPVNRKRNYKCQYVEGGDVKVQAQYTFVSTEESTRGPEGPVGSGGPGAQQPPRDILIIVIGVVVAALMLVFIIVAVILVKLKSKRNAGQDLPKHDENNATYASVSYDHKTEDGKSKDESPEDPESSVTYATVNHQKKKKKKEADAKKQVPEEGDELVTYAAVRTTASIPPQQDGSN